jgi:hypothetical protein
VKFVVAKWRLKNFFFCVLSFSSPTYISRIYRPWNVWHSVTANILPQRTWSVEILSDIAPSRAQINSLMTEIYFIYTYKCTS